MTACAVTGLILLGGSLSTPRVLLVRPVAAPQLWSLPVAEGDHLALINSVQRDLLAGAPIHLDPSPGCIFQVNGAPAHFRVARTAADVSPWIDVPQLLDARMAGSQEARHILRNEAEQIVRWGVSMARRKFGANDPAVTQGIAA